MSILLGMKRGGFNRWVILSLLLGALVGTLWLRSFWRKDGIDYDAGGHWGTYTTLQSSRGRLWFATGTEWTEEDRLPSRGFGSEPASTMHSGNDSPLFERFGFTAGKVNSVVFDSYEVAAPHWFVLLLTTLLPARWVFHRLRAERFASPGRCTTCGYDLRASPDRCPECGTIVPTAKVA